MNTKKLLRTIALCLIPIVLYFAIFLVFEPNNYFGLKSQAASDDIMARLREYERTPLSSVIIGDSRMAKFDAGQVEQLTGQPYANLAYGGASLAESLNLLSWLLERNPQLETVVLGLSYYNLNTAYSHNREIIKAKDNPFRYLTNLTYNINMWEQVYIALYNLFHPGNPIATGAENQTRSPDDFVYVDYADPLTGETLRIREDLVAYANNNLRQRTDNWSLNTAVVDEMLALAQQCRAQGVQLIVVLPPVDESVHRLIINPNPLIAAGTLGTVARLEAAGVAVLDYEFTLDTGFGDDMFFDGHHLDTERGLPVFTQMLFSEIKELVSHGP